MNPDILLSIIKLSLSALITILAISLMAKRREFAWGMIVIGLLISFAILVYDLTVSLGITPIITYELFNIPVYELGKIVLPAFFFILGLLIMKARND
ncbi:MAG: hypothetical protein J6R03_03345 [Treponema sp.]|jgi:hypothetical protein|nr:hypothetical protein [Treponema sp.]